MEENIKQEDTSKQESQEHNQSTSETKTEQKGGTGLIEKLEVFLDEYMVKKAPFSLPAGAKEFIVKVAPYLIIISAVMALPLILTALGFSSLFASHSRMMGVYGIYGYGHGMGWGSGIMISLAVSVIVLVMELLALPGLFRRTKSAWSLVFYASIVSLIGSIISISGIFSGIIGAVIGWYILFQIKDLYKN